MRLNILYSGCQPTPVAFNVLSSSFHQRSFLNAITLFMFSVQLKYLFLFFLFLFSQFNFSTELNRSSTCSSRVEGLDSSTVSVAALSSQLEVLESQWKKLESTHEALATTSPAGLLSSDYYTKKIFNRTLLQYSTCRALLAKPTDGVTRAHVAAQFAFHSSARSVSTVSTQTDSKSSQRS